MTSWRRHSGAVTPTATWIFAGEDTATTTADAAVDY